VYEWYKGTDPFGHRAGRIAKIPELLYVLGALLGDGCVYHWRNRFQVWLVGEERFTIKFAGKLSACLRRRVGNYKYGSKNAWFVRVDNAELFFLVKAARRNKKRIQELVEEIAPDRGWVEFIEGFFDAEGCVKIIKGKERITPKVCLDICNIDFALLDIVRHGLGMQGIEARISAQYSKPPRKIAYHLRVYSKDAIAGFLAVFQTTKLIEAKKPIVENWLTKRR
jgi:intein-encoded DNA endonuclease-like protein